MDNQHQKIPGYRDFDEGTLNAIKHIKETLNVHVKGILEGAQHALAAQRTALITEHQALKTTLAGADPLDAAFEADNTKLKELEAALERNQLGQRSLALGFTKFQEGAMWTIRALAQPSTDF